MRIPEPQHWLCVQVWIQSDPDMRKEILNIFVGISRFLYLVQNYLLLPDPTTQWQHACCMCRRTVGEVPRVPVPGPEPEASPWAAHHPPGQSPEWWALGGEPGADAQKAAAGQEEGGDEVQASTWLLIYCFPCTTPQDTGINSPKKEKRQRKRKRKVTKWQSMSIVSYNYG